MDKGCLFCGSHGPFTLEHVIPESLGNDDVILVDDVCSTCNNYFSKIENFVLQKTSLGFWRAFLGIRTKGNKLASVDLSQPKKEKGSFPSQHPAHDQSVGFTAHEDGFTSVDIDSACIIRQIHLGKKNEFRFFMTPKVLLYLGRFLCKIGVELICKADAEMARGDQIRKARTFARFGSSKNLWPIFHYSEGDLQDLRRHRMEEGGILEEVDCYSYDLLEYDNRYILFRFCVGTDNWIVCLNDPFPTPDIMQAFPGRSLQCIWYPQEELG